MPDNGRERTQDAMDVIVEARGKNARGPVSFQVFASSLLLLVAIMTTVTFTYVFHAEREAREQAVLRTEVFERHVELILEEIQATQDSGTQQSEDAGETLAQIQDQLRILLEVQGAQ